MSTIISGSYRQGAVYEAAGAFKQAAEHYQLIAQAEGARWPHLLYRLGLVCSKRAQYDAACCAFVALDFNHQSVQAVEAHVRNSGLHNDVQLTHAAYWWPRGLTYYAQESWSEAALCFQHALYRESEHLPYGQYLLGVALFRAKELQQACEAFLAICIDRDIDADPQRDIFSQASPSVAVSYLHYRNNLQVQKNTVVYESYAGVAARCNPRAIFDQRAQFDPNHEWLHVWVLNDQENIPEGWQCSAQVIFIPVDSQRYAQFLASTGYFINNSTASTYLIRRKQQKFLNTWHGTPLKGLGRDIKTEFNELGPVQYNFLQSTHLISPNPHTTQVLLDCYDLRRVYTGKLAETGYPRIDYTLAASAEEKRKLKRELGLSDTKPIVLFAPTWRGTFASIDLDLQRLTDDLNSMSSDSIQLVFRGHYFLEEQLKQQSVPCTVVPSSVDSNQLLSIVDILVTDYSSICIDFFPKQKPVIYYVYDQQQYAKDRGLYLLPQQMPGVCCSRADELSDALKKAVKTLQNVAMGQAVESYDLALYNAHDDGQATQRVIDFFFNDDDSHTVHAAGQVDDFYNVLLYPGSMTPGEVTDAVFEFIQDVDKETVNLIVTCCPDVVQKNTSSATLTAAFAEGIVHIPRVGEMALTRSESQCLQQVQSKHGCQLTAGESATLVAIYTREFSRVFGCAKLDEVLDCSDSEPYWSDLFAFAHGGLQHVRLQDAGWLGVKWRAYLQIKP